MRCLRASMGCVREARGVSVRGHAPMGLVLGGHVG